jgi:hypothetical protein
MARTKLTPYQLELRRQQNVGARTENLSQLNQRISYLAESSNRERHRRRTLALAQSLERREQRYQATLISDDELNDEIDDADLLIEEKIIPNTYDYTDVCFSVLFEILLSLLFDLTQGQDEYHKSTLNKAKTSGTMLQTRSHPLVLITMEIIA